MKFSKIIVFLCLCTFLNACTAQLHTGFNLIPYNISDAQSSLPILLKDGNVLFEPQTPEQKEVEIYDQKTNSFKVLMPNKDLKITLRKGEVYVNGVQIISPYSKSLLSFISFNYGQHFSKVPEFSSQQYSLVSANSETLACTNETLCKKIQKTYPNGSLHCYSIAKMAGPHLWLITGGWEGDQNRNWISGKAFLFDSQKNIFIKLPNLNFARYGHTSVTLPDGRVFIIGGRASTPKEISEGKTHSVKLVEVFDLKTRGFHKVGELKNGFSGHGSILLNNGKILIFGGENPEVGTWGHIAQSTAEIYDPTTSTSQEIAAMNKVRAQFPFAIKLPIGNVLITGGMWDTGDAEYSPETSAELDRP